MEVQQRSIRYPTLSNKFEEEGLLTLTNGWLADSDWLIGLEIYSLRAQGCVNHFTEQER